MGLHVCVVSNRETCETQMYHMYTPGFEVL